MSGAPACLKHSNTLVSLLQLCVLSLLYGCCSRVAETACNETAGMETETGLAHIENIYFSFGPIVSIPSHSVFIACISAVA